MPQTRRDFVRAGAASGAALILSPQSAALAARRTGPLRGARFRDGIMSGDPTVDGATLWTRLHGTGGRGKVRLEVASDPGFRKVVAAKGITTSGKVGHAVKARVRGLDPHEQYWYRFETADRQSRVGRFRTALPAGSKEPVSFAWFSCQDYTHGLFNAHELMAREDLDFVVCLGDYIYAETYTTTKDGLGVRDDRIGRRLKGLSQPNDKLRGVHRVAVTLDDYRRKYSLYRSDPALRKMHRRFPMIAVWDDHEVQNAYVGAERDGGLPKAEGFTRARMAAGRRAFFENMPFYGAGANGKRLYRTLRFGDTVELVMLDERTYRADQPCGDAIAAACPDLDRPRDFLGREQLGWLKDRLAGSTAAWKIVGNQVMAMPAKMNQAYMTFDSWHGYPREREELLQHIKQRARDVVFVTGDIHTFIAGDVKTAMGGGESVALEFVGGSVTSPGLLEYAGQATDEVASRRLVDTLRGANPWVADADMLAHGYGVVKATQGELDVAFRRLATIKKRSTTTLPDALHWRVERGQTSILG